MDDIKDEQAYVFGLHSEQELSSDPTFTWLAEYAHIDNVDGKTADDLDYFTVGGVLSFERYNISASFTKRSRNVAGGVDFDDELVSISAGVQIHDGWSLNTGYKLHEEEGIENHTVGILLAKDFSFNSP